MHSEYSRLVVDCMPWLACVTQCGFTGVTPQGETVLRRCGQLVPQHLCRPNLVDGKSLLHRLCSMPA